jgi:hypothetical protein
MITVGGAEMHGAGRGEPSGEADLAIRVPAFTRRMGGSPAIFDVIPPPSPQQDSPLADSPSPRSILNGSSLLP